MNKQSVPSNLRIIVVLLTVQVVWAFSYLFSKYILESFPPLIWASFRSLITGIILTLLALAFKRPHPRLNSEFFTPLLLFGFLNTLTQIFFLIGLHHTSSSNSAILNSVTPLITLAIAIYSGKEQLTSSRIVAFTLSLAGVSILCRVQDFNFSNKTFLGDFLTLLSCVTYGSFLGLSRDFFSKYDKVWITAWIFMVSAAALTPLATPEWLEFRWPVMTPGLWIGILYGILVASVLAYYLMIWVVSHAPASQVALFDYLQPILVSFLAWYYMLEKITGRTLWGGFMIILGIGFSMKWNLRRIPKLPRLQSILDRVADRVAFLR